MKKKEGLVLREVCGLKVIVGEGLGAVDFGSLLSVNETAAWLWEHIEGEADADRLAADMCREYEVDLPTATQDIAHIFEAWADAGVLVE